MPIHNPLAFQAPKAFINGSRSKYPVLKFILQGRVLICASTDVNASEVVFENCTMKSDAGNFLQIGPFAYSSGVVNVKFVNCEITHTGSNFIYMYAKPSDNSEISFEGCTITKSTGKLISWESGYNLTNLLSSISVEVKFKSTDVDMNLEIQNINTDKFKVIFE